MGRVKIHTLYLDSLTEGKECQGSVNNGTANKRHFAKDLHKLRMNKSRLATKETMTLPLLIPL